MVAAPRGFEPRLTDPKSAVLPLDEGAPIGLPAAAGRPDRARDERIGAEDGTRTRDPHLGKVMLYQLSHFRSCTGPPVWCREPGSNWRHRDFQSRALPTELSRPDGLEPGWPPVGEPEDTTGPERASTEGRFRSPGTGRVPPGSGVVGPLRPHLPSPPVAFLSLLPARYRLTRCYRRSRALNLPDIASRDAIGGSSRSGRGRNGIRARIVREPGRGRTQRRGEAHPASPTAISRRRAPVRGPSWADGRPAIWVL